VFSVNDVLEDAETALLQKGCFELRSFDEIRLLFNEFNLLTVDLRDSSALVI